MWTSMRGKSSVSDIALRYCKESVVRISKTEEQTNLSGEAEEIPVDSWSRGSFAVGEPSSLARMIHRLEGTPCGSNLSAPDRRLSLCAGGEIGSGNLRFVPGSV